MRRLVVAIVILLAVLAAAAGVLYSRVDAPFRGYTGEEQFIEIPPGAGPGVIGHRLVDAGVVRDRLTWRIALFQSGSARELKAGEYRFDVPLSPRQVIARLVKGDVYLRPITFPEGLTIADMAQSFQNHGFGSAADFVRAASDVSLVKAIDPEARDLEGYLFPDTYGLPRHASAAQLVSQMVGRFNQVFGGDLKAAAAHNLKVRDVVTLASIVEKETARPEERPDRRGGLSEPAADRNGAAVRPDCDLRAAESGSLQRQSHAREPAVRLALQHVSLRGPASGSDRRSRPRLTRGRTQSCVGGLSLFRQPQRRDARLLEDLRRAAEER